MRADEPRPDATIFECMAISCEADMIGLSRLALVAAQMWADRKMAMLLAKGMVTPEEAGVGSFA